VEELLIVDGYNVVNAWVELKELAGENLELARDKLLEKLDDYRGYKGIRVIVVFDAHLVRNSIEFHEMAGGVEVVYTKEGETADNYIERLVDSNRGKGMIRVATSDRVEQTIVMGRGAVRISARELKIEMELADKEKNAQYLKKNTPKKHSLENRLEPSVLEKLEKWRRQK